MKSESIMAIRCDNRRENADALQKVLTEFGCSIRMRLGIHETDDVCANVGLILLHLADQSGEIEKLEAALNAVDGVRIKSMEI